MLKCAKARRDEQEVPPLMGCQHNQLTMTRDAAGCQSREGGEVELFDDYFLDGTQNENGKVRLLFVRRLRRRAHVLVAQVTQHFLVLFAHAAGKARIIQVPVARGLRHILQNC